MGIQRLIVKLWRMPKALRRRSDLGDLGPVQWPNTTACMIRPGSSVNSPATTSAPVKMAIIALRCRSTRWRRACTTASGSEDREQMDRAPPTPDAQVVDPERVRRHGDHKRNPDPADGAMGQRPFGRGELDGAEPEGGQRRNSMQLGGGGGVQQRRERHGLSPPHLTPRLRDCLNWAARAAAQSGTRPSKGNLVVHVAALAGAGESRLLLARRRPRRTEIVLLRA